MAGEWVPPLNAGTNPISGGGSNGLGTSDAAEFDLVVNGDARLTTGIGVRMDPTGTGVQSSFNEDSGGSYNRVVDPIGAVPLIVRTEASNTAGTLFPVASAGAQQTIEHDPATPTSASALSSVRRVPQSGPGTGVIQFQSTAMIDDPSLPITLALSQGSVDESGTSAGFSAGVVDSSSPSVYAEAFHSASILVGNNTTTKRAAQANNLAGAENSKAEITLLADGGGTSASATYRTEHTDNAALTSYAAYEALALPAAEQARLVASTVASTRSFLVESTEAKATLGDVATNAFPGAGQYGVVLIGTPSGNALRVVPMVTNPSTGNFQYVV